MPFKANLYDELHVVYDTQLNEGQLRPRRFRWWSKRRTTATLCKFNLYAISCPLMQVIEPQWRHGTASKMLLISMTTSPIQHIIGYQSTSDRLDRFATWFRFARAKHESRGKCQNERVGRVGPVHNNCHNIAHAWYRIQF